MFEHEKLHEFFSMLPCDSAIFGRGVKFRQHIESRNAFGRFPRGIITCHRGLGTSRIFCVWRDVVFQGEGQTGRWQYCCPDSKQARELFQACKVDDIDLLEMLLCKPLDPNMIDEKCAFLQHSTLQPGSCQPFNVLHCSSWLVLKQIKLEILW